MVGKVVEFVVVLSSQVWIGLSMLAISWHYFGWHESWRRNDR